MMAMTAILPLAFVSCGSDGDDPAPTPGGKTTTLVAPIHADDAKLLTDVSGTSGETDRVPKSIDFDIEGDVTLHYDLSEGDPGKGKVMDLSTIVPASHTPMRKVESTTNPWNFEWVIGSYEVDGNNYTIPGFGVVNINGNGNSFTITFEDGGSAGASATPGAYNQFDWQSGIWACRYWKPTQTRIVINESGKEKFSGQWSNCNLGDIATNIKKTIGDFDDAELQELGSLKYIYISPSGYLRFYFNNGRDFAIRNCALNMTPDNKFNWHMEGNAGNSIINADGEGTITFDGNEAALQLSVFANEGKYTGTLMIKVSPR